MRDEKKEKRLSSISSLIPHPSWWRYAFCCTFPVLGPSVAEANRRLSDGGHYPPPRPVEPGLSSPRFVTGQRPSSRPANNVYPSRRSSDVCPVLDEHRGTPHHDRE